MIDVKYHKPVLISEVLAHLNKKKSVIDATLGTGGHSIKLLEAGVKVLGIESDPKILEIAKERLSKFDCLLVHGNFKDIDRIARENEFNKVEGILFDLGVSNLQLMDEERGFSFSNPSAQLDMRIDKDFQEVTGAILLNVLRKDQLENLFFKVLDLSSSRWLAKRVLEKRGIEPIKRVADFLDICEGLKGKARLNPATLPFLALRIAVNSELENLKEALPKAYDLLETGGKLLIIVFHSGEEDVIKSFSEDFVGSIRPTLEEVNNNPRARSAELFVLTKK
ncbi:MAG: 16S rRNA (cytosine(1402)-N(4))-methyltransferase RsmH [Candidatus Woesebacteria bacterium]|nr:16S rRNA (cytosine(1402)-N(4))-methyltransferase RsmH [Candidatus Woesebacteria bacterium]